MCAGARVSEYEGVMAWMGLEQQAWREVVGFWISFDNADWTG